MKIIHVALNSPGSPQHGLKRALASLGEVREIDWMANQRRGRSNGRELVELAIRLQPDLVFMQLQTGGVIAPSDLETLRCLDKPPVVVSWSGDVRHPTPQHYFDTGRAIDMTLFTNLCDVESLRAADVRAAYLQIGFDEHTFTPFGSRSRKQTPPIVFLGSNYGRRFPLSGHRCEMVKALRTAFGNMVGVYGGGWPFQTRMLNEAQEAECYRSCAIAIHQSHYSYGRYFSDRLLRAMGSGAFVLAHRWPGMELDFVDGEHLVAWDSFEELVEKARHYLAADERQEIADAGCELVHREHTWLARMPSLRQLTGLNHC